MAGIWRKGLALALDWAFAIPDTFWDMRKYVPIFLAIGAFLLPFALYIRTLAPTYIPIDSAEFALCMRFWGLCHPPGFPLYILLGKIFTSVWPFGSLIYKANLLSAIFGAGTVLLIYLTLIKLSVKREIAALTSMFVAVNQILWEFSIAADVFAFAAFLTVLTFFLVFNNRKIAAFLVLGLLSSHFYITAVLWPVLVWYFWQISKIKYQKSNIQELVKFLILASIFFAIGFFPQVIMYWRMQMGPEINWGHANGFWGFVDYLRRKEFGSIFLISNPILTFTLLKVFKQFWAYFGSFLANFAVFLPFASIGILVFGRLIGDRKIILLLISFIVLVSVQLFLLSTIDPLEAGSPFQLNKFYLSSFVIFAIILGVSLEFAGRKIFEGTSQYIMIILSFLIVIYFLSNLKINNYANNYFSQNMVRDALGQLPPDSIAITVSHIVYFGGLYEQKIDHRFDTVRLLYFPNEKNRDSEKYQPEVFASKINQDFVNKVRARYSLGGSEQYVLETLARNLDRPIFILQGGFEEKFFAYLKGYLEPWGLWWKFEPGGVRASGEEVTGHFSTLANAGIKGSDLALKQQKDDIATYAVAYHTAGIYLASIGEYQKALEFLKKSLSVNSDAKNINGEIDLIDKTEKLDRRLDELLSSKDRTALLALGNDLFTLQNFDRCTQVYEKAVGVFDSDANFYNNLGSCLASVGKVERAKDAYKKALEIDPNLDLAKQGLGALEK